MATVRELITRIAFRTDTKGIQQAETAIHKLRQSAQGMGQAVNSVSQASSGMGRLAAAANNANNAMGRLRQSASNAGNNVSSGVNRASSSFRKLSGMVGRAAGSVNKLNRNVRTLAGQKATPTVNVNTAQAQSKLSRLRQWLRNLSASPHNINIKTNVSGIGSDLSGTAAGLAGIVGGGMLLDNIKDAADEMMNLDGRLRTVTKTEQERLDIESQLYAMGQKTRQPMQSLGDLYFKVARASAEMGFRQKENLDVTETVSKALIIGGASAAEASATILQLGQALGSGRLQGDELRSLDENASILMGHVAKYFKTNVAGLKQMGAEGKLTSDEVMRAILSASKAVDQEFEKMPMTFGQSMNVMKNSWDMFILGVEQKSSVFSLIARSFTKAFDSMGKKFHDFMTLLGKPDPTKKVQITEAATGKTKEISETDYYQQKAAENPGMMTAINTLKKLEDMFDRLDGKSGNLDEQLGNLFEDFMKLGLVAVPILAVIAVIDGLVALLTPFIRIIFSIGGMISGAFGTVARAIGRAGTAIAGFFSGGLNGVVVNILGLISRIPSIIGNIVKVAGRIALPLFLVYSLIQYIYKHWEEVKASFESPEAVAAIDKIKTAWEQLQPAIERIQPILDIITDIVGRILLEAIKLVWNIGVACFSAVAEAINTAIWFVNLLAEKLGPVISLLETGLNLLGRFIGLSGSVNTAATSKIVQDHLAKHGMGGNTLNQENSYTFNVSSPGQAKDYATSALESNMTVTKSW